MALEAIGESGLHVWPDAGLDDIEERLSGNTDPVVGLESISSKQQIDATLAHYGSDRVVLSLDHRSEVPITEVAAWRDVRIQEIALNLIERGVRRFIDLDLARVGSRTGVQGRGLAEAMHDKYGGLQVAVGGGPGQ